MSGGTTTSPSEQAVYVRRTRDVNGETGGWVYDPNLRCQDVVHRAGPNPGDARLVFVPLDFKPPAIEDVMTKYHPDDQVRVELFPPDAATGADTPAEGTGLVVFEGVMERQPLRVVSRGERESEDADFVAVAMPWIDNRDLVHLVTGRWFHVSATGTWDRVETPSVPAAFNYRGRGNMDADDSHKKPASGGVTLTARPFTHDDDPAGKPWTVREAIKSLLVQWLYGEQPNARTRATGVESDTLNALESPTIGGDRFQGLDDVLPETDVSGMFVFNALDAVCRASGFQFAIGPDIQAMDSGGNGDRRYLLRLWRRHAGPAVDLMLPKRGAFPASGARTLERADVNRINVLRDNAGIINHVFSRGRVLIEAAVELKPLWKQLDMTVIVSSDSQLPNGLVDDLYHQRHVLGGSQFDTFGHVGRLWGIDCTGVSSTRGDFYTGGYYQHPVDGFDWLAFLGIDGNDPLTAERTARHLDAATDPIVWTTRVRRVIPLRRADSMDTARPYVLEASEDSGGSWTDVTDRVSFTTLRDFFGVRLTGLPNLSVVSNDTLGTDKVPLFTDSWWFKMTSATFRLRLTCLVEADHAALYRADRQATSGTAYTRGGLVTLDLDEVWSHPGSALNTGTTWQKIAGAPGDQPDATDAVRSAAERLRDAREGTRFSVACDTFLLRPDRWRVGDRVRGIVGRGVSFATNAGAEQRHPAIVQVKLVLAGPNGEGSAQGVFLSLNDTSQARGA